MAGPITWRTVNGPSLAEAGRPLEAAQRSIDSAFTGLGGLLKQTEAVDAANWNQAKENNTQDFLNKLYSAQGAEGFKALQDSGELERMLTANGAQIDRAAARSAMDGRLATLQNRDVQAITYRDTMLDDAQAGDVRRINTLALTDPAAASAELAKNPDLRKSFEIAKNIDASAQTQVERQRAKDRFGFDVNEEQRKAAKEAQDALLRPLALKKAEDDLLNGPSQRAAQAAQASLAKAQAGKIDAEAKAAGNSNTPGSLIDARYKELVANGPWDKGTLDTAEGKSAFIKGLKDLGLPQAAQEDVVAQVYKYYGKGAVVEHDEKGQPIRAPLGVSTALQAVGEAGGNTMVDSLFGWSRRGDQTANALDRMFGVYSTGEKNPGYVDTKDGDLIQKMQATLALRNQREKVLATPPEQVTYGKDKSTKKQK